MNQKPTNKQPLPGKPSIGLDSPIIMSRFTNDFRSYDWSKMGSQERESAILKIVQNTLNLSGVPIITKINFDNTTSYGEFDPKNWIMNINPDTFTSSSLKDPETIRQFGLTLYHEMRHAEQFFRVLQSMAAPPSNLNRGQITSKIGIDEISPNIIDLAIASVNPKNTNRVILTSDQIAKANLWYQSEFGTGKSNTQNIRQRFSAKKDELYKALDKKIEAAIKSKKPLSENQISRLTQKLKDQIKGYRSAENAYLNIPVENDAFAVERLLKENQPSTFGQRVKEAKENSADSFAYALGDRTSLEKINDILSVLKNINKDSDSQHYAASVQPTENVAAKQQDRGIGGL